jgi:hypothetical protein
MKLNRSIFLAVLLAIAAVPLASNAQVFVPDSAPEPANIAELRRNANMETLEQCSVPVIAVQGDWIKLHGPDEFFEILLPPDWRLEALDSTPGMFPVPRATFRGANGDRISVARKANGATSMAFMRNEAGVIKPERHCEVSDDKAGSILSFYSGIHTITGAIRSVVLGDAVTPEGKRYGLDVASASPARIDTLVALAGRAIIAGRQH